MEDKDWMLRLETKMDKVVDRIGSIDVTIAKQQVSIDEHVRRCNLLEEGAKEMAKRMAPLERRKIMVDAALRSVGLLATIAGIGEGTVAVLTYFKVI